MQALDQETRQWVAGGWLDGATLAPLAELNAQCLELVVEAAKQRQGGLAHDAIGRQIAGLAPAARAELALAPYLLADAGFDDPNRWQGLPNWRVQDVQHDPGRVAFPGVAARTFVRSVMVYGWHLARSHRQLARVVLGMTPATARNIATLGLSDLHWACDHRPEWVTLRWEGRPQLWSPLLSAARLGDRAGIRRASLRGIQLMGAMALERRGQ